jgi:hypothetical protein
MNENPEHQRQSTGQEWKLSKFVYSQQSLDMELRILRVIIILEKNEE